MASQLLNRRSTTTVILTRARCSTRTSRASKPSGPAAGCGTPSDTAVATHCCRRSVCQMMTAEEAKALAYRLLADELPRRWAHTKGVARRARSLAIILGDHSELVEVAAFLHDIGYS